MKTYYQHIVRVALLVGLNCGLLLHASTNRLFPDLTLRYPVGDPDAINPISTTEGPKTLVTADMNNDGLADVVAGNLDGSISVLLGRTNNTLSSQILLPANGLLSRSSLRALVVADFNGDQRLDVAAGDIAGEGIIILLGNGDGTLFPYTRIPLGPVRALAVADFNHDGTADLLAACSPAECEYCYGMLSTNAAKRFLCLLDGQGNGTFASPRYLLAPGTPACFYDVAAADLNADGHMEAISLDFSYCASASNTVSRTRRIQIFENDGWGGFRTNSPDCTLEMAGEGPRSFQVAYLDEHLVEGHPPPGATPDIIVANRDSSTLDVFLNLGGLNFSAPRSFHAGEKPRDIGVGDLDGDGYVDLVLVNRDANSISVMRGLGAGVFADGVEFAAGGSPRQIAVADFTGDGVLDAVVNNRVSEDVSLFIGQRGIAGFLVPEGLYAAGDSPVSVVAVDFNHDGYPDVATANLRSHDIRVRLNRGDGTLSNQVVYPVNFQPAVLTAGDLNGDGQIDLVVTCIGSEPNFNYTGAGSLMTLLGRGDGTFQAPLTTRMELSKPFWLRLGDLDGDHVLDAAVGGVSGELLLFRGLNDGRFQPGVRIGSCPNGRPLGVALGDFNADGRLDIATSRGEVFLNGGHFFDTLNPAPGGGRCFDAGAQAWATETADLDEDGQLDLMVALTFRRPDPIGVLFGVGDGNFTTPTIYEGPDVGAVALVAQDMDGDGIKDLVVGNRCAATVIILKGLGHRQFEYQEIVKAYTAEHVAVADMNQDGRPDIVGVGCGLWVVMSGSQSKLVLPHETRTSGVPDRSGVFINEIMSRNEGFHVTNYVTPDWVELYNHSAITQSMSGWALTQSTADGVTNLWRFPENPPVVIPPYGHLVVYCVRTLTPWPGLFANFQLSADGENIALLGPGGAQVDFVRFPALPSDVSYARTFDGGRFFAFNAAPSLGTPNQRPSNIKPSTERKDPYVGPGGSSFGLNARAYDDVAVAYAAVCYRPAGSNTFAELPLEDDGLHGDKLAGDGYYGALLPAFPAGTTVEYYLRVVDTEGQVATSPDDPNNVATLHRAVAPALGSALRITEVLADNATGLRDERGQREDWLELYNSGSTPMSLDNLALTKDYFNRSNAWSFPAGLTLQPGKRAIVFCDEDLKQGPLHANFKLVRSGDRVFLMRKSDWTILDSISFGPLPSDTTFGVMGTGTEAQLLAWPTPGMANLALPIQSTNTQSFRTFSRMLKGDGNTNQFAIRWFGDTNQVFRVNWTQNLTTWNQSTNVPVDLGQGLFQWRDAENSGSPQFYRVLRN